MDMKTVLEKNNFVKLKKEGKYQHRSAHEMGERYALTLNVKGDNWRFFDDRGDLACEGKGADTLDQCLSPYHLDEE